MLKKFLIGTFALVALTFAVSASAAYDFGTTTLRVGSRGEAVKNVQTVVGATPVDGVFGNITKAKVMAWQAAHGLTADGVVGPATKAAMNAAPGTPVTGLPAGCTSTVGYSSTTGVKCDGGTTTPDTTGPLTGGAGDLTLSTLSTDVEDTVKENSSENVLGFKAEADGSDIAVTSVKLVMANIDTDSSERLTDYIDEVKVFMGSKEVGSADASDFSRDAGTPDVFSQTISLTNATVREGDEAKFYVEVSTGSIDSEDITNGANFVVTLDAVRYQDATGAILSESGLDDNNYASYSTTDSRFDNDFTFESASADDRLDIKSSSSDPDAGTVKVEENDSSDKILIGAFKLDVDEDSTDITINELPIVITVSNNTNVLSSIEDVIDSLVVEIDGDEYDAEISGTDLTTATGTVTYMVEFDADEMVIEAGDVVEVKIYATFNDQSGNYDNNTVITADVDSNDIDAEGEEDDVIDNDKYGIFSGEEMTLSISSAVIDDFRWTIPTAGTFIDFFFSVDAQDDSFDVQADEILGSAEGTGDVAVATATATSAITGTFDGGNGVLTRYSGDDVTAIEADGSTLEAGDVATGFQVAEGDTVTFRVRFSLNSPASGEWEEVTITSVAGQTVSDDKQVSPTATVSL